MKSLESFLPVHTGRPFSFSTFAGNRLRTVGLGFILPKEWSRLSSWNEVDAQALGRMLDPLKHEDAAAARGKLVLVGLSEAREAACSCYQTKDNHAIPVFCGNSSAAAAALISTVSHFTELEFQFICDKWLVGVVAEASIFESGRQINQTWRMENQIEAIEVEVLGHKSIVCSFLNDYLIVRGPIKVPVADILSSEHGIRSLRSKMLSWIATHRHR